MPKKPAKSAKPAAPAEKKPEPKAEPKRIIFRLYECVIHLDQAEKHLNGVGIFPPGDDGLMEKKARALELVDELKRAYSKSWNEMQKEAGL